MHELGRACHMHASRRVVTLAALCTLSGGCGFCIAYIYCWITHVHGIGYRFEVNWQCHLWTLRQVEEGRGMRGQRSSRIPPTSSSKVDIEYKSDTIIEITIRLPLKPRGLLWMHGTSYIVQKYHGYCIKLSIIIFITIGAFVVIHK